MGSVVPFQDLNLSLSPPYPAEVSPETPTQPPASPSPLLIPKLEPKLEPLDSPIEAPQEDSHDPFFPDFTPNFFSISEKTPTATPPSQQPPESSSDDSNVFLEYNRISEMFRTAFGQRSNQQQLQQQPQEQEQQSDYVVDDSRALITVNNDENNLPVTAKTPKRHYPKRSSELVRVTDLGMEDRRYFRDVVRRTRMLYDALRIFSISEEEKRRGEMFARRTRGDLMASSVMRDRGLWLNRDKRIVGSIPGVEVGDIFFFRMELCVVGLHGQVQAGIDYLPASQSSNGEPIATSVIVSGGYEDDEDSGDTIVYTGHGGQDKFGRQCTHQKLHGGNLGLERSMNYGIEVRVIRGFKYAGSFTNKIYVYDGLYKIHDCWFDVGKSGFGVYKFKLVRIDDQATMGSTILKYAQSLRTAPLTVRPKGYLSLDISNRKEKVPIMLFNDIDSDHDPLCFEYLVNSVFPTFAYNSGSSGTGCDCVGGCAQGCLCAMKNGGEFAYDQNGCLLRGKPLVFECGDFCKCPPSCRNRVSQKGLKNRLEVFRSKETGWGVRSLDLIHAGTFICEYAGVVLTRDQAQVFTMNGDSLIYPNRFAPKWAEWGDLSQIYSDYVRPSYPSIPPLDISMDVSRMRNVACYMSHSSTPNVMVQYVLYDHNSLMFPHLMLFALENIPPLREISLDYGVADEWTGKLSICI